MSDPEFHAPSVGVGGVVLERDADGELCVLLIQRKHPPKPGSWTFPGGRLEPGERVARAIERELLEETGLEVRAGELLLVVEILEAPYHFIVLDHACERVGGELRAGDDAADAAFVRVADLGRLGVTQALLEVVERALVKRARTKAAPE